MYSEIIAKMNLRGWTMGGCPGSSKLDAKGVVVALYGEEVWKTDFEAVSEEERGNITSDIEKHVLRICYLREVQIAMHDMVHLCTSGITFGIDTDDTRVQLMKALTDLQDAILRQKASR